MVPINSKQKSRRRKWGVIGVTPTASCGQKSSFSSFVRRLWRAVKLLVAGEVAQFAKLRRIICPRDLLGGPMLTRERLALQSAIRVLGRIKGELIRYALLLVLVFSCSSEPAEFPYEHVLLEWVAICRWQRGRYRRRWRWCSVRWWRQRTPACDAEERREQERGYYQTHV